MSLELADAVSSDLNRMRAGDWAAVSRSVLLPQDARASDLFPGRGTLKPWHAFYVHRGIRPQAGDEG